MSGITVENLKKIGFEEAFHFDSEFLTLRICEEYCIDYRILDKVFFLVTVNCTSFIDYIFFSSIEEIEQFIKHFKTAE